MGIKNTIRERAKKSFLIRRCFNKYCAYRFRRDPKALANSDYRRVMGKNIDWEHPKNLIEKIYWMLFNTDTSLWSLCADKYNVRSFVEERGCGDMLNELYGSWQRVEDIDYKALPDTFVLKTSNSSGQVILVDDKRRLDVASANRKLNRWLHFVYGLTNAQLHYMRIKPCVIAEKLLLNVAAPGEALIDYKFWCFDGVLESVLVVYDRKGEDYKLSVFDLEWNNISSKTLRPASPHFGGDDIAKPASFERMIEAAKKLSTGFPEVRVDFYDINGMPIFGELTFSTGYSYFTNEYYDYLGSKVDLSKTKTMPTQVVLSELKEF